MSPIFIDKKREENQVSEHLNPEHEDYVQLFSKNLITKYIASGQELKINDFREIKIQLLNKIP